MSEELQSAFDTDFEAGQDNVQVFGLDLHNPVFFISSLLVVVFVIGTLVFPDQALSTLNGAKAFAINHFDWLFMLGGNIFVLFCLAMIVLPMGRIRLGGDDAKPEFSRASWLAMLFVRHHEQAGEPPAWMLKNYVKALNSSQPHACTITAHRNHYYY